MSIGNLSSVGKKENNNSSKLYTVSVVFYSGSNIFGNFLMVANKNISTLAELRQYIYENGSGTTWKNYPVVGNIIANSTSISQYQPYCSYTIHLVSAPDHGTSVSIQNRVFNTAQNIVTNSTINLEDYTLNIYSSEVL